MSENTKNKILNAAESIALRDGAARLTLDAVALEAGLSKGGVLYNYPSKDALVRGMVGRLIEQTEAEMVRIAQSDPEPRGRLLRSYLTVTFPENGSAQAAHGNQVAAVLLTAILTNPSLLEPVRRHFIEIERRLMAEGTEEYMVHIVRLAADGLWLSEMLHMPGPEGEARHAVIRQLFEMTRG
ncbi:MAG: TetR/AcrR family transcriptional regulator [Acidobacteriia bacterium]|nr:TetR/AcrR family transcriptional regulator [Terriglobia bacterium]